jgi:hypothetical protein
MVAALKSAYLAARSSVAAGLELIERAAVGSDPPPIRVALVKQTTYLDLLSNPRAERVLDVITSSRHRSGPVGLLVDLRADCYVVHAEKDPECQIWREKGQHLAYPDWDALHARQLLSATRVSDVDWSLYDVVVAIENAVPERITRRYPTVVWATMVEHHRMRAFAEYTRRPPAGYDFFLNQRFGPTPASLHRPDHVVEWPYVFTRGDTLERLLDGCREDRVVLEANQSPHMASDLRARLGVQVDICGARSLIDHLMLLRQARVFYSPASRRPLWGNAAVEAVSAGCVAIGNRHDLWNPAVIPTALHCSGPRSGIHLLERLLADPAAWELSRNAQRQAVDWHCFWRPLAQLRSGAELIPRRLSLGDALNWRQSASALW